MIKSVTQHSYFEKKPNKQMGRLQNNPSRNPTSRWVHFKTTRQLDGCTQNLHMHIHQLGAKLGQPWGQRNQIMFQNRTSLFFFDLCWTIWVNLNPTIHSNETNTHTLGLPCKLWFVGLAYQEGKDIVFRFIIEYSSFKGFWSLGNNNRSIFI